MTLSFINIGAAKCGTTTLHDILIQHPGLCIPEEKDFHFFDNDEKFLHGLQWYEDHFKDCTETSIRGEISATYLYSKNAAERIADSYGTDIKILAIVRDPARRAFSEYLHQKRARPDLDFNFNTYFRKNGQIDASMPLYEVIIDRSLYYGHLLPYAEIFGRANLKVLFLEDLSQDPQAVIADILEFINVESGEELDISIRSNVKFVPRNKWFHGLFYSDRDNAMRKLLRSLVPSFKSREAIRRLFKKFNRSQKQTEQLDPELYDYLMTHIFARDIQKLEELIESKTALWRA